ncbi:hypothetical protein LWP59_10605 [Amycolatopsis acidiphila]|nr:hypothetical protein LWP59_10605 [Amycolatopsis acidiphila]
MISVADSAVDSRTVDTYDGAGRIIDAAAYNGVTFTWDTKTVYGGDRTTTIPPAGGVTTSTLTDTRGHTTETRQFTTAPTINGSVVTGGTYQSTLQAYNPLGQLTKITDASGNVWTSTYDLLGNKIQATDPGTGTTHYTYDLAGQLTSSTDARNQTLAYTYDPIGRATAEYSGSTTGTKLASWVYDTVQKGKLTYSTRYTPQGNYLVGYGGYDGEGNPTSLTIGLPSSETGLSGNHTTQYEWSDPGRLASTLPAPGGGLPGEWVSTLYDSLGNATSSDGYNGYVSSVAYTPYGEPAQVSMGDIGMASWLTYDYDAQTRRLNHVNYSAQTGTPQLDDTTYRYDPVGNPIRTVDVQGVQGGPTETQCYAYDALDRLSQAWTATDSCAASPTTSVIGGTQPYWQSWTFDPTGLRQTQTIHALPGNTGGDTTTNYTYPSAATPQAATLTSTATTGPGGNSSTGYTYDADGNTLTRTVPAGNQTLTWDAENHLASVAAPAGTTSYVYDADGNELVRHDPGSTTLYLPGEELTYNTSTATVTGTRYYQINDQTVALRVGGANPTYVAGDPHGSMQIAYRPDTGAITRRALDPYGNPLGSVTTTTTGTTTSGTWPDAHGFLNKPQDPNTGLTDIGARTYDPTTGRFLSVDPVLNLAQSQGTNGYAYGADNPVSTSDPTGLEPYPSACVGSDMGAQCVDYYYDGPSAIHDPNLDPGAAASCNFQHDCLYNEGTLKGGADKRLNRTKHYPLPHPVLPKPTGSAFDLLAGLISEIADLGALACGPTVLGVLGICQRGDTAVQQTLVAHGADPNSQLFAVGKAATIAATAVASPEAAAADAVAPEAAASAAADPAALQAAVEQRASQVVATQSIRQRGPVLTGAMDTKTGDIFFGQNTGVPDPLHPVLQQRLDEFPGPGAPYKGTPGAHSEINAVNQGLFARSGSQIDDFIFYNVRLRGAAQGEFIEMCPNCAWILGK